MPPTQYPPTANPLRCPVCSEFLHISLARGRRSGKPFLMLVCPRDGRHFRGFINDKEYVAQVVGRLEAKP